MKKFLVRFAAVLLAFQGLVASQLLTLTAVQAAGGAPTVVINEVMWMGSSESSADEWIELRNTTEDPINISGWKLTHAATSDTTLVISSGTIPANGYYLISNFAETSASSVLNVVPDWVTTSISLQNACVQIDLTEADDTIVDSMGCDAGSYFYPANSATKEALERNYEIEDGLLETSWHQRTEGSANLDALVSDLATPKFVNDVTEPITVGAVVSDGSAEDINWSDSLDTASANWSGFVDPESGLTDEYIVELYDSANSLIDSADVTGTTHMFTSLSLTEGEQYHFEVSAINGVDLLSAPVLSDGFVVDTVSPEMPTNVLVLDTPADNGGSVVVSWDASVSLDEISYQLSYRKQGTVDWTIVPVGMNLSHQVSGLENAPTNYEFTVEAIDFSNRHSLPTTIVAGQALDNLAPTLSVAKVVVGQNKPMTADTVSGIANAVSESSTVSVFDRDPSLPGAVLLGSVVTNMDGSFASISIGDNQYATVYLQAIDVAGNATPAVALQNDIVAPNAATLNSAVAACQSESCRVELHWTDNGPDTATYQVGYTIEGVEKRTLPLSSTGIALDLPVGKGVSFAVYAFDHHGNQSVKSNAISIQLTAGVKTTATYSSGSQNTVTEAIPGSREVVEATPSNDGLKIAPPAKAAEPIDGDESSQSSPVKDANDQDWSRIFIVILLLLIVAGGFYSLSRTFRDVPADEPLLPVATKKESSKPKTKQAAKSKNKKRRR